MSLAGWHLWMLAGNLLAIMTDYAILCKLVASSLSGRQSQDTPAKGQEKGRGGQQCDKGTGMLTSEVGLGTLLGGPWGPVQNTHFGLSQLPSKREPGYSHTTSPLTQAESCSGALGVFQHGWPVVGVDTWHSGRQRNPSGRATWRLTVGKTQRLWAGKQWPSLHSGPEPLHCFDTSKP